MKMVTAIVRTTNLQHVVQRREKIGIKGLTISEIKGLGEEVRLNNPYSIHDRTEIIVADEKADEAARAILEDARTGLETGSSRWPPRLCVEDTDAGADDMNREERLKLARENVEEAKLLYGEKIGTKVVFTKLYHALMYCLFALFDIRIIGNITHADIIERFEQEYVKTGKTDAAIFDVLRRAYDLTHECDCDHMPVPTDEEIASAMKCAEELIRVAEGFLGTGVTEHESNAV